MGDGADMPTSRTAATPVASTRRDARPGFGHARTVLARSLLVTLCASLAAGCAGSSAPPTAPTSAPAPALGWVDGGAGRLRVSDGGTGAPTIVFVHGLGGDHSVWDAQAAHLRRRHRVVAYDQRGHGESTAAGADGYTFDALADDLEAVHRALDLGPVVLVGHSMGGGVISTYAGRHPDEVVGLIYLDAIGDLAAIPREEVDPFVAAARAAAEPAARLAFFADQFGRARPGTRDRVEAGLARLDATAFGALFTALGELRDGKARVAPYRGPSVAIEDATNHSPDLASIALGVPRVDVADVSHWLQLDDPDAVNRALDAFLATLPAAPRP